MKTKILLLCGALLAACSLTSCDMYGYPVAYGYGTPYYNSRPSYYGSSYYSRPLMSYSSIGFSSGYSRPYYPTSSYGCNTRSYSSFGSGYSYNRGASFAPPMRSSHSYTPPMISHAHHSAFSPSSSFGGSSRHHGFSGGSSLGGGSPSFGGGSHGSHSSGGGSHGGHHGRMH